jgi:thymidylate kinase
MLNLEGPRGRDNLAFIVLEGFSGTGKTTLAQGLESRGWLRMQESAHAVPRDVPVAERADTAADFSLLGATMTYSSQITKQRHSKNIVAEGYLLGDLAYAKIRFELKKSRAYPSMLAMCRNLLEEEAMRPDLYIVLRAGHEVIGQRQRSKEERERNETEFFRTRYYTALEEIHSELHENRIEVVQTDSDTNATLANILEILDKHKVTLA